MHLSSIHLFSEGTLTLLLAAVILLLALGWVLWQHTREFHGTHQNAVRRTWLPALRVGIVILLGWLLLQPVLAHWRVSEAKPRLLVMIDAAPSMNTREDYGGLHRKIDLLSMLENRWIAGRDARPGILAARVHRLGALLDETVTAYDRVLSGVDQGLPVPPSLSQQAATFRTELERIAAAMPQIPTPDRPELKQQAIQEALAQAANDRSELGSLCDVLANDAELVAREASSHLQLLRDFRERLQRAAQLANHLHAVGQELQGQFDEALLPAELRQTFLQRHVTRLDLATLAADRIRERLGHRVTLDVRQAVGLSDALDQAFHEHLRNPLAGVIVLSDGARGLDANPRLPPVPIHTALVGRDGLEPADLALIAVDLPDVAVARTPVTARLLVKNHLPPAARASVDILDGDAPLPSLDLGNVQGIQAVPLPLDLATPGRHLLTFRLSANGGDSFPGNQEQNAVVDVAAFYQLLRNLAIADITVLLEAPELSPLEVGEEANQFPAEAKTWQGVDLAVLVGDVPNAIRAYEGPDPIAGLESAIQEGLHVYVHDTGGEDSWAQALQLDAAPAHLDTPLTPREDVWYGLYRLGLDREASRLALHALGDFPEARVLNDPPVPLLFAGKGATAAMLPRGKGAILYEGLGSLAARRSPATSRGLNRLLSGLVNHALRPLDTDAPGIPPPTTAPYRLAPRAAPLQGLARASNGSFRELPKLDQFDLDPAALPAASLHRASLWALWHGWWPLPLLLLLVTAEYLLRRRAGRVM